MDGAMGTWKLGLIIIAKSRPESQRQSIVTPLILGGEEFSSSLLSIYPHALSGSTGEPETLQQHLSS